MTGEGPKKGGADGFGDLAGTRGALDQLLERLNAAAAGAPDTDVHSGGPAVSIHEQTDVLAGGSVDDLLGSTPVAVVDAVPHHDAVAEAAHIEAPAVVDGGTLIDNLLGDPVEQPLTDGHTTAAVDGAVASDPASFVAAEPDIAAGTGAPLAAAAGFSTLSDTFDPAEAQSQHVALQQHVGLILPAFRSALLRGLAQPVTTLQEAASLLSSNTTHFAGRTEIEAALPDLTLANRALPHAPKTATETARLRELNARLVVHHDALMKLFSAAPSPKPIDAVPETFTLADAPEDVKRAWAEYLMTFDGFNSRVALVNGQRVRFFKDDPRHQAVQDAQGVLHAEVAWQAPLRTGTLSRDTHTKKFFDQQRVALSVAQSKFDAVVTREEALNRHFSKDRCANILDRQVRTLATELGKVYKAFTGLDAKQDVAAIPEILAGITPYVPLGEGQRARDLEHAYRRAVESVSVLQTGGFPAVPVLNNTELLGLLSDAPDARRDLAVRSERALDAVQELLAIAQRNGPRTPAEVIALAQTIGRGVSNTDKGSSVYFYNPQTRAFEQRPIQSTDLNTPFGLMYGDVRVFPTKGLDTEYDSWLAEVQKAIPGYVDRQPQRDNASLESDISEVKFEAPAGAKAQGWIKSWIGSSWFGSGQPEAPAVVSGRTFEAEEYDEGEARLNNPANAKIREALDAWIAGATGTEQYERAQDRYLYVRIFGRRKQKPTDAERPTYERVTMAVADYEREKAKREAAQERNKKALAAYERQFSTEQKDELVRLSMLPVASGGISEKDFDELMGYYASAQAWQKVVSPDISLQGRIDAALEPWMRGVDARELAHGETLLSPDDSAILRSAMTRGLITLDDRTIYVRVLGRSSKTPRKSEGDVCRKVESVIKQAQDRLRRLKDIEVQLTTAAYAPADIARFRQLAIAHPELTLDYDESNARRYAANAADANFWIDTLLFARESVADAQLSAKGKETNTQDRSVLQRGVRLRILTEDQIRSYLALRARLKSSGFMKGPGFSDGERRFVVSMRDMLESLRGVTPEKEREVTRGEGPVRAALRQEVRAGRFNAVDVDRYVRCWSMNEFGLLRTQPQADIDFFLAQRKVVLQPIREQVRVRDGGERSAALERNAQMQRGYARLTWDGRRILQEQVRLGVITEDQRAQFLVMLAEFNTPADVPPTNPDVALYGTLYAAVRL